MNRSIYWWVNQIFSLVVLAGALFFFVFVMNVIVETV